MSLKANLYFNAYSLPRGLNLHDGLKIKQSKQEQHQPKFDKIFNFGLFDEEIGLSGYERIELSGSVKLRYTNSTISLNPLEADSVNFQAAHIAHYK